MLWAPMFFVLRGYYKKSYAVKSMSKNTRLGMVSISEDGMIECPSLSSSVGLFHLFNPPPLTAHYMQSMETVYDLTCDKEVANHYELCTFLNCTATWYLQCKYIFLKGVCSLFVIAAVAGHKL